MGQRRNQDERPDHVPQEHEGQQDAHIGLKLDGGKGPRYNTSRKGHSNKRHHFPGKPKRPQISLRKGNTVSLMFDNHTHKIQRIVNTNADTQRNNR